MAAFFMVREPPVSFNALVKLAFGFPLQRLQNAGLRVRHLALAARMIPKYRRKSSGKLAGDAAAGGHEARCAGLTELQRRSLNAGRRGERA
jgi:hypothetical protein